VVCLISAPHSSKQKEGGRISGVCTRALEERRAGTPPLTPWRRPNEAGRLENTRRLTHGACLSPHKPPSRHVLSHETLQSRREESLSPSFAFSPAGVKMICTFLLLMQ
jgi:hypothetical protein